MENRLTHITDADGNTTGKAGGEVFAYNHDNRLINYSSGGTLASYQYDPAGRRISKTVNGITTWYLWDDTSLLAEYNSSGSQTKRYAYLPGRYAPAQMVIGSSIYDVLSDHLDTPKRLTDGLKGTYLFSWYKLV
jgi:YD repeat-containing protein